MPEQREIKVGVDSVVFALNLENHSIQKLVVDQLSMGTATEVYGVYNGVKERSYQVLQENLYDIAQFRKILSASKQDSIMYTYPNGNAAIAYAKDNYIARKSYNLKKLTGYTMCSITGDIWVLE